VILPTITWTSCQRAVEEHHLLMIFAVFGVSVSAYRR